MMQNNDGTNALDFPNVVDVNVIAEVFASVYSLLWVRDAGRL